MIRNSSSPCSSFQGNVEKPRSRVAFLNLSPVVMEKEISKVCNRYEPLFFTQPAKGSSMLKNNVGHLNEKNVNEYPARRYATVCVWLFFGQFS